MTEHHFASSKTQRANHKFAEKPVFTIKMSTFMRNTVVTLVLGLMAFAGTFFVQTFQVIYSNQEQIRIMLEKDLVNESKHLERFESVLNEIKMLREDFRKNGEQIQQLQQQQMERESAIAKFYQEYSPALKWADRKSKE